MSATYFNFLFTNDSLMIMMGYPFNSCVLQFYYLLHLLNYTIQHTKKKNKKKKKKKNKKKNKKKKYNKLRSSRSSCKGEVGTPWKLLNEDD